MISGYKYFGDDHLINIYKGDDGISRVVCKLEIKQLAVSEGEGGHRTDAYRVGGPGRTRCIVCIFEFAACEGQCLEGRCKGELEKVQPSRVGIERGFLPSDSLK